MHYRDKLWKAALCLYGSLEIDGLSDLFLYILLVFMYLIVNHNFITIESKNIIND